VPIESCLPDYYEPILEEFLDEAFGAFSQRILISEFGHKCP